MRLIVAVLVMLASAAHAEIRNCYGVADCYRVDGRVARIVADAEREPYRSVTRACMHKLGRYTPPQECPLAGSGMLCVELQSADQEDAAALALAQGRRVIVHITPELGGPNPAGAYRCGAVRLVVHGR